MFNKVKELIDTDTAFLELIKQVYESPYITNKVILDNAPSEKHGGYEKKLRVLVESHILVELTSQSGSSIESRVPQKIFIINPEIEEEIEQLFS